MLLLVGTLGPARAEVAIPELKARVTDLTGTLAPDTLIRLESTLALFEKAKGSQIAVLMLPTTEPEDIAAYGIRVAEQWKIGRKGVDDGVILIVAKDDRRVRIEVGYGLEGVISDAIAKRIIEEDIVPRFKTGDFSGGVEAGVSRMMRLIEGEPLPPPSSGDGGDLGGMEYLMPVFIIGIIGGKILGMFLGDGLGASVAGVGAGAVAWLLSSLFMSGAVVAILVFVFVLLRGSGGGGGWSSGGGGFGGGGGFSGGGGSFGGGGSSGSW